MNYEEAIKNVITLDNLAQHPENRYARDESDYERMKKYREDRKISILNALHYAQKEHELLGLYQKRFSFYNFDEDKQLREIKALEKELEEMK
jgi:hypothetical protein